MTKGVARYDEAVVESMIQTIRGQRVILDTDLAKIYGVPTKRLNDQVRRNAARFPLDFTFKLAPQEVANLKSQFATSSLQHVYNHQDNSNRSQFATSSKDGMRSQFATGSEHGGRRKLPYAFTEHG